MGTVAVGWGMRRMCVRVRMHGVISHLLGMYVHRLSSLNSFQDYEKLLKAHEAYYNAAAPPDAPRPAVRENDGVDRARTTSGGNRFGSSRRKRQTYWQARIDRDARRMGETASNNNRQRNDHKQRSGQRRQRPPDDVRDDRALASAHRFLTHRPPTARAVCFGQGPPRLHSFALTPIPRLALPHFTLDVNTIVAIGRTCTVRPSGRVYRMTPDRSRAPFPRR